MENFINLFESYITESEIIQLFEASNLSKTGMPKKMISAIHQKEEHKAESESKLGYVNRGGRPLVVPYKYYKPSHDIEIGAPARMIGRPVEDPTGARKSRYPDLAQYLIDIPLGPIRVLLASPENDLWMYLYHKSPRQGGGQYAILIWDAESNDVFDYGFVGLTVEGVDKHLVRDVHHMKGGNTNQKVQEIVSQLTNGGPSRENPILVYEFDVNAMQEPKHAIRPSRTSYAGYPTPSVRMIELFASKYAGAMARMSPQFKTKIKDKLYGLHRKYGEARETEKLNSLNLHGINTFSAMLGADRDKTFSWLYEAFAKFRQEMLKAGGATSTSKGAYGGTSGHELQLESDFAKSLGMSPVYNVTMGYDPSDPRPEPAGRKYDLERHRRKVVKEGSYAGIDNMISAHTLEGTLSRFMTWLLTGEISNPAVNLIDLIFGGEEKAKAQGLNLSDISSWIA